MRTSNPLSVFVKDTVVASKIKSAVCDHLKGEPIFRQVTGPVGGGHVGSPSTVVESVWWELRELSEIWVRHVENSSDDEMDDYIPIRINSVAIDPGGSQHDVHMILVSVDNSDPDRGALVIYICCN